MSASTSASSTSAGGVPALVLWSLLGLCAIGAAFVCVMYALTAPGERGDLLASLTPLLVGVVAGVPALIAALRGEAARREHGAKLDQIERQTNGELRAAMRAIVAEQLDVRGLMPRQRADDEPAEVPQHAGGAS